MENIYCKDLKLDFEVNLDELKKIRDGYKDVHQYMIFPYPKWAVDERLNSLIESLGLYVSHQEVFYTPPHGKLPIHVDQYNFSNMTKLNWVIGGKGSHMVWWKPKPGVPLRYYTTPIGTQYLMFEESEVDEVFRGEIGLGTFVNAGVPHSIDNPTDDGRWTLSHCLSYRGTKRMIEWPQMLEIFKDYL